MAQDMIGYDRLARESLRAVVREALRRVADDGLPGAHHFYITFRTRAPGVDLDETLLEKFPEDMTIVLEHKFWDLAVDDDAFEVTLEFSRAPKYLRVPFDAVVQFNDPSVDFGLRFDAPLVDAAAAAASKSTGKSTGKSDRGKAAKTAMAEARPAATRDEPVETDAGPERTEEVENKVVSLDAFRKKSE